MKKRINNVTVDFRAFGMYRGNADFQGCTISHTRYGRTESPEVIELVSGEQMRDLYYALARAIDEMDRAK